MYRLSNFEPNPSCCLVHLDIIAIRETTLHVGFQRVQLTESGWHTSLCSLKLPHTVGLCVSLIDDEHSSTRLGVASMMIANIQIPLAYLRSTAAIPVVLPRAIMQG